MGDQRRRSKSRGCQKEQEEQRRGEEEEVCGRVYTVWAWPLLTVHPGERKGGREGKEAGTRTGEVEGEVQEANKGGGAKKKRKEQMTDEMSR